MKSHVMSRTENVTRAMQTINYLLKRPKSEMVGLGLIWGPPGLGKTRFARRIASQEGFIWMRLEASTTPKSFVRQLFNALKYKGHQTNEIVRGCTNDLYNRCLELIEDMPDTVIMLDEIDYAFHNKELLGTIRDIVDQTTAAIVLIGMNDARNQLQRANAHYFDRCNSFCQFKPLSMEDIRTVISEVGEVKFADDLSRHIWNVTHGNLRQAVKLIYVCEEVAKVLKKSIISLADTGELSVE